MGRESGLKLDFPVMNFYDGQTYLVPKTLKVTAVKELNGASICLTSGSTGEVNTADYFRAHNLTYKPVVFQKIEDAEHAYAEGRCDAILGQAANLAALRANLSNPDDHLILPELISKEPMGPVTRGNDRQWSQAIKWIVNALLFAEEKGVTQSNVAELAKNATDPEFDACWALRGPSALMLACPPTSPCAQLLRLATTERFLNAMSAK